MKDEKNEQSNPLDANKSSVVKQTVSYPSRGKTLKQLESVKARQKDNVSYPSRGKTLKQLESIKGKQKDNVSYSSRGKTPKQLESVKASQQQNSDSKTEKKPAAKKTSPQNNPIQRRNEKFLRMGKAVIKQHQDLLESATKQDRDTEKKPAAKQTAPQKQLTETNEELLSNEKDILKQNHDLLKLAYKDKEKGTSLMTVAQLPGNHKNRNTAKKPVPEKRSTQLKFKVHQRRYHVSQSVFEAPQTRVQTKIPSKTAMEVLGKIIETAVNYNNIHESSTAHNEKDISVTNEDQSTLNLNLFSLKKLSLEPNVAKKNTSLETVNQSTTYNTRPQEKPTVTRKKPTSKMDRNGRPRGQNTRT